uniref:Kinesin-like protein n=1 Tax=Geotrypetes seraphini TaxID=260995 RepID=A0A6P8PK70_GEOSA|nr:kinesin-like protein KIF18A [Geotrypetes seraphini]
MSTEDVCSHVRVVVRVRPQNQRETEGNFSNVVQVVDKHILVFDPEVEEISFFHGKKIYHRDINKRKNKDLKFVFDAVFSENSTQMEVYENTTKVVLDGFLNGYNCTVLAYGATGAGKTHTMLGSPGQPGVMYLTMMELYDRIHQLKEEKLCELAISYLEVYNEQIHDLLTNSGPLAVREDAQKGVVVQGLSLHQPKSAEEILQMLDFGNKNRTQHPTDVNATSSRSHAVFQIYLRQQDKTASICHNVRLAKMCLIDLAGSERVSSTNAKGARFREGANINRSLLALGNVINALADPKNKKQHIPYRNSKLTRLLKDSLGGNCRTIMIAAVSSSSMSYDDTYNTLKYANRAKDIKSTVKSNVVSLDSHISQYVKICEQQKKEIIMLKEKLKAYEEQKAGVPENLSFLSSQEQSEIKRFQELLKSLFANREGIRKEILTLELQLKENELRTFYQKRWHEQIHLICSEEKAVKAICKRDHKLAMLKAQHLHIQKKKEEELKHFEENTSWLHRLQNEMRLLGQDGNIPEALCKDLHCSHLELEVKDLKAQVDYMMRLVILQEQENKQTEKLLKHLLPAQRQQYFALKEAGLATSNMDADFQALEHLVWREKVVVWADQTSAEEPKQNDQPDFSILMAFPHIKCSQSTPCGTEKYQQSKRVQWKERGTENTFVMVRPFAATALESKENLQQEFKETVIPAQNRAKRKLMESPKLSDPRSNNRLDDSFSKDLFPILYTPENCKGTTAPEVGSEIITKQDIQNNIDDRDFNMPFQGKRESDAGCEETDLNSTVILCPGPSDTNCDSSDDFCRQEPQACSSSNVFQRYDLAILPSKNLVKPQSEKPSYMAMTSAAERKRKLFCSASSGTSKENLPESHLAKRIRQDNLVNCKALRVPIAPGSSKNADWGMQRQLLRSISEGNLSGGRKRTSTFLKSRTFMHVIKKKP